MNQSETDIEQKFHLKVYSHLEQIDVLFGKKGIPLENRSFLATELLFKRGLVQYNVAEQTDLNTAKEKAFNYIHLIIHDWYEQKYGKINYSKRQKAHLFLNGISYELAIPLSISQPTGDNVTAWMHIPKLVEKNEKPLSWIVNKPNFNFFSKTDIDLLNTDAVIIASALRNLNVCYISVGEISKDKNDAYKNVIDNFTNVSNCFLSSSHNSAAAMWSIHFAVEEMLKFSLKIKDTNFSKTHDLESLYKLLYPNSNFQNSSFDIFPKKATDERYSSNKTLFEIYMFYKEALKLCSFLADDIKKDIHIESLMFELKYAFAI